jgi:hypothetical protein
MFKWCVLSTKFRVFLIPYISSDPKDLNSLVSSLGRLICRRVDIRNNRSHFVSRFTNFRQRVKFMDHGILYFLSVTKLTADGVFAITDRGLISVTTLLSGFS